MDHPSIFMKTSYDQKKYDLDLVEDVLLSRDDEVVFIGDSRQEVFPLELIKGSLSWLGLPHHTTLSFKELLAHFDQDNAYAEVSSGKDHLNLVSDLLYDFENRPLVTFPIRTGEGRYWLRLKLYPIAKAPHLFAVFITDVTTQMLEEEHLFHKTHHDSLTGLYNKYTLDYHYGLRYMNDDFHVLFLDLDNFKELNDREGHTVGNDFLLKFALILKQHESHHNRFYRIGGDEFVGLFFAPSSVVMESSHKVLEATRSIANKFNCPQLSVSIGVVKAQQRVDVIRKADQVLYEVKLQGKNQVIFKDESDLKD